MTFLAPLFLLGGLAIAGPILFHLIRRTTREHTPFSSLMFLRPTPPRMTRRSRLENLWLLLLRCLALALLAFAFARPFFQQQVPAPPPTWATKRTVLLLDTSASMRRGELWQAARDQAENWLRRAAPEDEMAVLTFARGTTSLVSFERWRQAKLDERVPLATQLLASATPGWAGTQLGPALLRAAELLDTGGNTHAAREIVVISDLQEGAKLDGLQGFAWPTGVRVVLETVRTEPKENANAQWLAETEENETVRAASGTGVRLRVASSAGAKREQFRLQWMPGPPDAGLDVYVPAGQARTVRPPAPPQGALKLVLSGDGVDFDNTLHVLPPAPTRVPVLFLGDDLPDDPKGALYYLRRAFPPTREQTIELTSRRASEPVTAFDLQHSQFLILGEGLANFETAREFATSGKIAFIPLTGPEAAVALGRLLGVADLALTEARVRNYALLAQIDFAHPFFTPFADPRFSDFTKIHFWRHRTLDPARLPAAKVLAQFDDGAPALLQVPLGAGSVVVLTTTWRLVDSELARSSKFVPLLHSILDQSSRLPPRRPQYFIGDSVPLPPTPEPFRVRKPDGTEVNAPTAGAFAATDEPGLYTVTPGGVAGPLRFVVNLPPEESRLEPFDPAKLTALGVPLQSDAATSQIKPSPAETALAQAAELEARQKLWRWLLVAAVTVLLIETLIAARLSRIPVSHAEA